MNKEIIKQIEDLCDEKLEGALFLAIKEKGGVGITFHRNGFSKPELLAYIFKHLKLSKVEILTVIMILGLED